MTAFSTEKSKNDKQKKPDEIKMVAYSQKEFDKAVKSKKNSDNFIYCRLVSTV